MSNNNSKKPLFWLYNNHRNIDSVIKTIDSVIFSSEFKYEITSLILISKENLIEVVKNRQIKNFELNFKSIDSKIYKVTLTKKIRGSKRKRKSRFLIVKHSSPHIYILITHEKYKKLNYDIISYFNKFYPKITRHFIGSRDMKKILERLNKRIKGYNIRVSKYSSRRRIVSKDAEKKIESDLKHTDLSLEEVFRINEENDEWIKFINIFFKKTDYNVNRNLSGVECKLSRNGYFTCNKFYGVFYTLLISNIINLATKSISFLSDRERKKQEKYSTKPIMIEYESEIFEEKGQIKKLTEVLDKIILTTLSVYHSNPHLHCSLVDFGDGSSYEIWVLSTNRIIIVPQVRASYASLEKIINRIFMGLKEGTIKDLSD